MPRRSSWWHPSRPSRLFAVLAAVLAAVPGAIPAEGATILEKTVRHTIRPDGSVLESVRLQVRMETPRDAERWSPFAVYLDDHRKLESLEALVTRPGGKAEKIRPREQDTVEDPGGGVLHGSQRYRLVPLPAMPPGSVFFVAYEIEVDPYFPGGIVALAENEPIARLAVEVEGAPAGWRWRVDGPAVDLAVEERAGGVRVIAEGLAELEPPDQAPGGAAVRPVLRYAWGAADDWPAVGEWYRSFLDALPRTAPEVVAEARRLTAGRQSPRERLEALLGFVQGGVRYVAVEVGAGGYRPSPPPEVLERRWGDCKDKSLLLIDLLAAVGIDAHPALILSSTSERIDPAFPSPHEFNHLIVAVPAAGLELEDGAPVAEGFLFVDPTQDPVADPGAGAGGPSSVAWLHPGVQDQHALVVRAGASALVRLPVLPQLEARELAAELTLAPDGDAAGTAALRLTGRSAATLTAALASADSQGVEATIHALFTVLLPGFTVGEVELERLSGAVPAARLTAAVTRRGFAQGAGDRISLRLPSVASTPSPGILDDRRVPVLVPAGVARASWRLRLPESWCPPAADRREVDNSVGRFVQEITSADGAVTVERQVEIRSPWVAPEAFDSLRELALAEHRSARRRMRFSCGRTDFSEE